MPYKSTFVFVDYTEFNLLLIAEMTDNENLNDDEGKELSWYAKQRAKYKEELDAKDQKIASLEAQLTANKKAYFLSAIQKEWYQGDFNEFADKYAGNLEIDEMVALFRWTHWWAQPQQKAPETITGETIANEQPLGPKSIIGQNPIDGDQPKRFEDLSVEEMKAYGRSHPEIFNQ